VQRIGPGGHFLGDAFTLKHFQTAFSSPEILDYEAWEHWQANGSRDMQTRARDKAANVLKEYQAPAMDIAIREALDAFVEKRQQEISPRLS
jgi:trimethylamine--corrinoid protein Co-methyltransferase